MRGPRLWQVVAAAWALVIVLTGVVPTHEALEATVGSREDLVASLGHFGEYAVLAFALAAAFGGWRVEARALALAGGVSIALGWAMEVVQLSLPYRDFQVTDGLVDTAGAVAGLLVFSVVALSVGERRPARP